MSKPRTWWEQRLGDAWQPGRVVWLSGVRRVGKTTLARSIPDALLLNCDLPSTARRLEDPERFFASLEAPVVVLDEVHQLPDPSRVLKIGADAFPQIRIIATGSSTLAATRKFRDSLTGRKRPVHLLPILFAECPTFGVHDLRRRLLHGGLPEALLAETVDPEFYAEWLDSFFARDIQELFRVGNRQAFLRLVELLLRNSGQLTEVTRLAKHCGASRPTVMGYLEALQVTHAVFVLRPFHGGGRQEILRQPKTYGFDTGFVCYAKGWEALRPDDHGILWEHLVLETLLSRIRPEKVNFWRDKQKREVDFVLPGTRDSCDAIECKWNPDRFEPRALNAFRSLHPLGRNFLLSPLADEAYEKQVGSLEITVCNPEQWASLNDARA